MNRNGNTASHPVGTDGYLTFALSNLVIALTLGIFWLNQARYVYHIAKSTGTDVVKNSNYILVFGMRLINNQVNGEFTQRLQRAAQLFKSGLGSKIVVLGGITGHNTITEAKCGKDYLVMRHGIPENAILLEESSRHTLENLHNARKTLLKNHECQSVLISNRFHLARSHTIAEGLRVQHELCSAEDNFVTNLKTIKNIAIEAYFLHWYHTGRIWATLTRNKKSLSRIT